MNQAQAKTETPQNQNTPNLSLVSEVPTPPPSPGMMDEIDIQIATAHRYPRNLERAKNEALAFATLSEESAAACFYKIPRKKFDYDLGKEVLTYIEGPSVRLAEIVASCWGNLRSGAYQVREETNCVVVRGSAHDLEKNVATTFEVKRNILYKNGTRFPNHIINETTGAACAIALRNAIFKVIPKTLVDEIYQQAKKKAIGDQSTLEERRQKAIDHFAKMGVSQARILAALQKKQITQIDLDALETLIGAATAIKEGSAKIDEMFPDLNPQKQETKNHTNRTEALADKVKKLHQKKQERANKGTEPKA